MDRMTTGAAAREIAHNIERARNRTLVMLFFFTLAATAAFLEAETTASTLREQKAASIASGSDVVAISSSSMPGQSCARMGEIGGVLEAGAVQPIGRVRIVPGDTATVLAYRVTPSFLSMMGTTRAGAVPVGGVVVDSTTATTYGIRDASTRDLIAADPTSRLAIGARADHQVLHVVRLRKAGADYDLSVFVVGTLHRRYGTCYVALASSPPKLGPTILAGFISPNAQATLLVNRSTSVPAAVEFAHRPARWLWIALALLGSFAALLVFRARAGETSLYRVSGAPLRLVVLLYSIEYLIIAALAFAAWPVLLVILCIASGGIPDMGAVNAGLVAMSRTVVAMWLAVVVVATLSSLGNPWGLLRRER